MPDSAPYGEIVEDLGQATSGGASKTEIVLIRNPDGAEWQAHAKFAQDVNGQLLAENGARGLAAEFLASRLGDALGANVPQVKPVSLPAGVSIRLRNGEVPAPGLAAASRSMNSPVDVTQGALPSDTPADDVVRLVALHSWVEAQDRGHNLILSENKTYSVDHATAFGSAWNLTDPSGNLVIDPLLTAHFDARLDSIRSVANQLRAISDLEVDAIVDQLPRDWVPSDELRDRLAANIKTQRDLVSDSLAAKVPETGKTA